MEADAEHSLLLYKTLQDINKFV